MTESLSVAELWLDAVTDLPPSGGRAQAWSRSEWVEHTLPAWNELVAPVAASVADALATVLRDQLPEGLGEDPSALPGVGFTLPGQVPRLPAGALGMPGDPAALMQRLGAAVFGMQVGQAAGTLSREVFGATDVGLPLLDQPGTVLLPTNVEAFAEGLDAPADEVRLFLAPARRPTRASSRTSRGCAGTCAAWSMRTRAASPSTCPRSSRSSPTSTSPTRAPSSAPCPAASSGSRTLPSSRPRSCGSRRRSRSSRAGSTR